MSVGATVRVRALLAGLLALAAPVHAQDTSAAKRLAEQTSAGYDRAQLERRIESVSTLLTKSSAARQVAASDDPGAQAKVAEARAVFKQATDAFSAGDLAATARLLSAASGLMFEAVRVAPPEQIAAQKKRADLARRLESVKALLSAQKRIATEKQSGEETARTAREIETLVGESERLAGENRLDDARAIADRAYLIAKAAISSMRGGSTLVRSLHFATRSDEYQYELERNDTHQLLVKMVLKDAGTAGRMAQSTLNKAAELRAQAEGLAARGGHEEAIRLLEESTAELVKVIRAAGLFIPG